MGKWNSQIFGGTKMKTYLVTGAAGFIGANFLKYILNKHKDIFVVVLDKLTYAGNLKNIENELKDKRVEFVKGDILSLIHI